MAGETSRLLDSPVFRSLRNSANGLCSAWTEDESFRRCVYQAIAGITLATLIALGGKVSIAEWFALVASLLPILIVELLNTAIEAVTDKASPERHPLAKKAKDIGSAAVLMTRVLTLAVWVAVLL